MTSFDPEKQKPAGQPEAEVQEKEAGRKGGQSEADEEAQREKVISPEEIKDWTSEGACGD